jgi:hypothetical protein
MFKYVHPSILGQREFTIAYANIGGSEDYLNKLTGELAKTMCNNLIELEFSNPDMVKLEKENPDWQPFARATNIVATKVEVRHLPNVAKFIKSTNTTRSQHLKSIQTSIHQYLCDRMPKQQQPVYQIRQNLFNKNQQQKYVIHLYCNIKLNFYKYLSIRWTEKIRN